MSDFGVALVWCTVQATVIAATCGVLCFRRLRLSGPAIPLAGLLAILVVTACAVVPLPSWWTLTERISPAAASTADESMPTQSSATGGDVESPAAATTTTSTSASWRVSPADWREFVGTWRNALAAAGSRPTGDAAWRWPLAIVLLFLAGTVWGLLQLSAGLHFVRQHRRRSRLVADPTLHEQVTGLLAEMGSATRVELRESADLTTAATFGWFRPLILLPVHWCKWTAAERRAVLAHELAHICRGDYGVQLLSQVGLALHFFNPAVHWLVSRLRLEQELAADAAAASLVGGPRGYLRILATMALDHSDLVVGWPARHFLPTRRTFLRRIEMLRDAQNAPRKNSPARQMVSIGLIALAGLVAVGLRNPDRAAEALAQAPPANAAATGFDLRYVSDSGGVVIALQPVRMLAQPHLQPLTGMIDELTPWSRFHKMLGLSIADVEQLILCQNPPAHCLYLRSRKPMDSANWEKLANSVIEEQNGSKESYAGHELLEFNVDAQTRVTVWRPDNRSLVLNSRSNIERFIDARPATQTLLSGEVWKRLSDRPAVVVTQSGLLKSLLVSGAPRTPAGQQPPVHQLIAALVGPVLEESRDVGLAAEFAEQFSLRATAICIDEKGAQSVRDTVQSLVVLGGNGLKQVRAQMGQAPPAEQKSTIPVLNLADRLVAAAKVERNGLEVTATFRATLDNDTLGPVADAIRAARAGAQRQVSMNNLKQIALGFHNFHDAFNHFPGALEYSVLGDSNKRSGHPHSWRVALLPFMEQHALYNEYKFDQPWDSPDNLKVLKKMPAVYRHPLSSPDSTETSYFVFNGPRAIFDGENQTHLAQITDGTSNTVLAVEAKRSVPWTKPEDIPFDTTKPLPKIEGFEPGGYCVSLADGSVRFVSKNIAPELLQIMITKDGGEPGASF